MKNIFEDFKMVEPLKKNRFLIHFEKINKKKKLFNFVVLTSFIVMKLLLFY